MAQSSTNSFRFLDLPREIRDEIYRKLLCSFEPRPTTLVAPLNPRADPSFVNEVTIAQHSIDTSILRTSKQVHCEGRYGVMIKTNRFVHVSTSSGPPIRLLLNHFCIPVVTGNKELVERFQA